MAEVKDKDKHKEKHKDKRKEKNKEKQTEDDTDVVVVWLTVQSKTFGCFESAKTSLTWVGEQPASQPTYTSFELTTSKGEMSLSFDGNPTAQLTGGTGLSGSFGGDGSGFVKTCSEL